MKGIWISHPEELARLAAAVSHGRNPAKAVAYALELCRESEKALERVAIEEGGISEISIISLEATLAKLATLQRYDRSVPQPTTFPASLDVFFRLIVKAKTPADCTKRLRDFLRYTYSRYNDDNGATLDSSKYAAGQIQRMKDADKVGGSFTKNRWIAFAGLYLDWWKIQKSVKARDAVSKRKPRS